MEADIQPGSELGQYRIVKRLGSGLFSEVFLATHTFLDVDRALKVLHRSRTSPAVFKEYCDRYRNEWRLAANIHHVNLVEVYDVFERDGVLIAVVEFAPNGTLKDKLDQGEVWSEDWVLGVLRDCANGILRLHNLQQPPMIHRFVSPRTIVFDKAGNAKITNLGRVQNFSDSVALEVDEYDRSYQAPELSRKKVAPTSDVFSLGCVAFEMLTGKQMAQARIHSPRQLEPTVPEWLDRVVSRMTNEQPCFSRTDQDNASMRYFDMEAVLRALEEGAQNQTVSPLLRAKIVKHFTMDDLRNLCADLYVNYENIKGSDIETFAMELIKYFQQRERTGALIVKLRQERPRVDW